MLTPEQQTAYRWGLIVAAIAAVARLFPGLESWHAAGPRNIGHTETECGECHIPAPGNFVGQALTNMMYAIGLSDSEAYFVYAPVVSEQCLVCHENPDNRHPVAGSQTTICWKFAFVQPEFATDEEVLNVQSCVGCHREHLDVRVAVTARVCQHCHEDTALDDDPVDIPHTTLISDQRWETCLGCHDFHGNHDAEVPTLMSERLTEEQIQQYLDGGESPYGHRRLTVIQTMRSLQR